MQNMLGAEIRFRDVQSMTSKFDCKFASSMQSDAIIAGLIEAAPEPLLFGTVGIS